MRRSLLALCALLLVGSIALSAFASPQPTPVCGPCGAGFENAAAREDVDLTVTESTATVQVHDDGSATWRVTNHLQNDSAAAYLRNHSGTLDTVVTYAIHRSAVKGPVENRSAGIDGRTVVITFEDRYATTEMPGGVHVLDYVHSRGYDSWYVLTADRFTVVGPEGAVVSNDPPGATVQGRNATWQGNASTALWDAPTVGQDAYVAFAEPGAGAAALTVLAIALSTLPIVVDVLVSIHLPALVLFGLALAGVSVVARWAASRVASPRGLAIAIGVGGVVGPAALVLSGGARWILTVVGFGAVALSMAGVTLARGDQLRPGELVGVGALALVVAAIGVVLTAPGSLSDAGTLDAVGETIRPLPLVVAPALGAALADGNWRRIGLTWTLTLTAFFGNELLLIPPTDRPFGLAVIVLVIYALAVAVLSLPVVLLGTAAETR